MSTQTSEFPGRACFEEAPQAILLQASLREFVNQFNLIGCCLFELESNGSTPFRVTHWGDLGPYEIRQLETAIDWHNLAIAPLFQTVSIEIPDSSTSYHVSGCLCSDTSDSFGYLLCCHQGSLSEHQRYGISLYAQTLRQSLAPPATRSNAHTLQEILQRTRHQLRTPLELVLMYVDLLTATATEAKSREWLKHLQEIAAEMHVSLEHLTENPILPNRFEVCDLRQLFEQCCQGMQPWLAQKSLKLVCDSPPVHLEVNGWKIKQVLQNLLSNAIAFSPPGGQITCEWQAFQTEVLIKVTDGGPGLSEEDLRSLGKPFYSRRAGGTGLGLFIARQIIAEHQGSLWAENLLTGGAQFCVVLLRQSPMPG